MFARLRYQAMHKENGAAFFELIFSVFILGACLLFIAGVGSFVVTNTTMRVVDHLSAQSALVAYDRKAFDSETGLSRTRAIQAARESAALTGKAITNPDYLKASLFDLNQVGDGGKFCSGTDLPTQTVSKIDANSATDTLTIEITAASPWQLGIFGACLDHKSTIVGAYE